MNSSGSARSIGESTRGASTSIWNPRAAGTNAPSMLKSLLAVPRRPVVCQVSWRVTSLRGTNSMRVTALPSASSRSRSPS